MKNGLLLILLCCAWLSQQPIASAQQSSDSLLLYLPLDGNTLDASGNGNNGIVYNVLPDTDRFGNPQGAYRFNGIDSYIEIPASPSMNRIQTSDVVSISAWINIYQWYNNINVFSVFERYNPFTDAGWLFEANWAADGILFLGDETNSSNWATCTHTWDFHQWHHLCLTYDQAGDTAHFYLDGQQLCATPYSAAINVSDTTTSFVIGRSLSGPDEYSDGLMDDIRVYNRVLTPNEINSIFLSQSAPKQTQLDVNVYPNPTHNNAMFNCTGIESLHNPRLIITDLLGRTLLEKQMINTRTTISLHNMLPGLYTYRIAADNGLTQAKRLVVY